MIILIQKVEDEATRTGAPYKKVTGLDTKNNSQTTKSVFDNLLDKWPLLMEGKLIDFTLEKKGQYWNVVDLKPASTPSTTTKNYPQTRTEYPDGINDGRTQYPTWDEVNKSPDKPKEWTPPPLFNDKTRGVAMSYTKDLVVANLISLGDIGTFTIEFEKFLNNEIDGYQLDKNLNAIRPKETK